MIKGHSDGTVCLTGYGVLVRCVGLIVHFDVSETRTVHVSLVRDSHFDTTT